MNMKLREMLMTKDPAAALRDMDLNELRALEPALADLKMDIPRGFHHKDNLEHSIRVLDGAVKRETEPDLILRTAALFHDIGKPVTRKFGARKSVTFDGHEHVGSGIVKKILPQHGFTKDEIKKISHLVRLHMRSHGFDKKNWTDSAVRRLISDVGDEKAIERLIIIFYADCTTTNDKKREKHYAALAFLEEEIARVKEADERKALRPALDGFEVMELTGLSQGKELGLIMRYLNSDEGIQLSRDEAIEYVKNQ